MNYAVVVAIAVLLVSGAVLYRSIVSVRRRSNPDLDEVRRENERLRTRIERAERDLGIAPDDPTEEDRP
ncbi:MAG: hypothetical protein R3362_01355 [Rhodothermales bacterium]|nr:hypothetical protein [Rhodothermales bacterium]